MTRRPATFLAIICIILLSSLALCDASTDGFSEYESYDATYSYRTSGSTSADYSSELISVRSDADILYIQAAIEGYPLRIISEGAFDGLDVDILVIPATVEVMSASPFRGTSIEEVVFLGDRPQGLEDLGGHRVSALDSAQGWNGIDLLDVKTVDSGSGKVSFTVISGEAIVLSHVSGAEVTIPERVEWDGSKYTVTRMGDRAFYGADVTLVHMPDSIRVIGVRAFYLCDKMVDANIPGSIEVVCDEAFRECAKLQNVDLHGVRFLGFESFRMCYSMTEVRVPDSTTDVRGGAFYVCSSMESVSLGRSVDLIDERVFGYTSSLNEFSFDGTVAEVRQSAFYRSAITSINLPDVTNIGDMAFYQCDRLESATFGSGLISIGESSFSKCLLLEEVSFPPTLENIGNMCFYDCRSLEKVTFNGDMPEFGSDVFRDTDASLFALASHVDSWKEYDGDISFIDEGKGENQGSEMYGFLVVVFIVVSTMAYIMIRRRHD